MATKRLDIYGIDIVMESPDNDDWWAPGVSRDRPIGITISPTLRRYPPKASGQDWLVDFSPELYGNPSEEAHDTALRYVAGVIARTGWAAHQINQQIRMKLTTNAHMFCADFCSWDGIVSASGDCSLTIFVHKSQRKQWRDRVELCLAYVIASERADDDALNAAAARYHHALYDVPEVPAQPW